jgi:hypothetical protein
MIKIVYSSTKLVYVGIILACLFLPTVTLAAQEETPLLEMKVRGIAMQESTNSPIVVLEAKDSAKALFVWVGLLEATAIDLELNHVVPPRPMTHDLLKSILEKVEAPVKKVRITELKGSTYYAYIDLVIKDTEVSIDARPSDAIALALRTHAPIYVTKKIMDERSIDLSEETKPAEESFSKYGMTVQTLTAALARLLEVPEGEGVLVAQVDPDTIAAKTGLNRGDIIIQLDSTPIKTWQEFKEKLEGATGKEISLKILREGKPLDLILKLE